MRKFADQRPIYTEEVSKLLCSITESSTSMMAMQEIKIILICSFKKKIILLATLGEKHYQTLAYFSRPKSPLQACSVPSDADGYSVNRWKNRS